MSNIMDYLTWRGDLTLKAAPWNLVDSLILANFCYNDVGAAAAASDGLPLSELAPGLDLMERTGNIFFVKWRELLYAMAKTARYGGMRVHDYVDQHSTGEVICQFSALTAEFSDELTVVAFRGTDASIAGWREDCNMSFETVPAQLAAVEYLTHAAAQSSNPIVVVGHGKGGNLAAYAGAHVPETVQQRLISVCSFDGPGLDAATLTSPGYEHIAPILTCMIPQSSVVGLMLGYHRDYTIVHSDAKGILQHDAFSWQLEGPHFQLVPSNNLPSQWLDRTVHDWLAKGTLEDRKAFVDTLFGLVEALHATTTDDLSEDKVHTAAVIIQSTHDMAPESRKMLYHVLSQLVSIAAVNSYDMMVKPIIEALPSIKSIQLPLLTKHAAEKAE